MVSALAAAPRRFLLVRNTDVTGVSGTGHVAEGIEYSDGVCSMHWVVPPAQSTTVYKSIEDVVSIHGHNGSTQVLFLDSGESETPAEPEEEPAPDEPGGSESTQEPRPEFPPSEATAA